MKGLYVPFTKNAVEIKRSVIINIGERIHEMTLFLSTNLKIYLCIGIEKIMPANKYINLSPIYLVKLLSIIGI